MEKITEAQLFEMLGRVYASAQSLRVENANLAAAVDALKKQNALLVAQLEKETTKPPAAPADGEVT